jgi:hypothetical protein
MRPQNAWRAAFFVTPEMTGGLSTGPEAKHDGDPLFVFPLHSPLPRAVRSFSSCP